MSFSYARSNLKFAISQKLLPTKWSTSVLVTLQTAGGRAEDRNFHRLLEPPVSGPMPANYANAVLISTLHNRS